MFFLREVLHFCWFCYCQKFSIFVASPEALSYLAWPARGIFAVVLRFDDEVSVTHSPRKSRANFLPPYSHAVSRLYIAFPWGHCYKAKRCPGVKEHKTISEHPFIIRKTENLPLISQFCTPCSDLSLYNHCHWRLLVEWQNRHKFDKLSIQKSMIFSHCLFQDRWWTPCTLEM